MIAIYNITPKSEKNFIAVWQRGESMEKIKIERNTLGDTRTATRIPTFYEFVDSNNSHVKDVSKMMDNIADEIRMSGRRHDYTKTNDPEKSLFYRELCATIEGKMDSFVDGEWYPMHCKTERHHLNEYCPDDVNLIDVIEMICDCVCAGMSRSGIVRPIEIDADILKKALDNTVNMLADTVVLEGSERAMSDLIDRQAAIEIVRHRCKRLTTACVLAVTEIEQLPSAQPQRKVGRWEMCEDSEGEYGVCSECGCDADFSRFAEPYEFCPNCGARMDGESDE